MEIRDVITYNQKLIINITDKEIAKFFYDKDYGILLTFLRSGPKSVKEIEAAYIADDNEKSDKTIYRYIKTLEEVGLVVEAGKRIYTDEQNKNTTLTIYIRTAKIFVDKTQEHSSKGKKEGKKENIIKAYNILLDNFIEEKNFTFECVKEILGKIETEGYDFAYKMIEKADEDLFKLLEGLDFTEMNIFILNLAWLILTYKKDFKDKMHDC